MNTNKIATGSVNRKLLAALAVLAVAFVVLAAVPAVADSSDADGSASYTNTSKVVFVSQEGATGGDGSTAATAVAFSAFVTDYNSNASSYAGYTVYVIGDVTTTSSQTLKISTALTITSQNSTSKSSVSGYIFQLNNSNTGAVAFRDISLSNRVSPSGTGTSSAQTAKYNANIIDGTVATMTGANVTISNVDFTTGGDESVVAAYVRTTGTVSVTGSTFTDNGTFSSSVTSEKKQAFQAYSASKLTFTNNTITNYTRGVNIDGVTSTTASGNTMALIHIPNVDTKAYNVANGQTVNTGVVMSVSITDSVSAITFTEKAVSGLTDDGKTGAYAVVLDNYTSSLKDFSSTLDVTARNTSISNPDASTVAITVTGTLTVPAGTTLNVNSGVTITATGTASAKASVQINGSLVSQKSAQIVTSGDNASINLAAGATVTLDADQPVPEVVKAVSASTYAYSGTWPSMTVSLTSGSVELQSGTLYIPASFTAKTNNGTTLTVDAGAGVIIDNTVTSGTYSGLSVSGSIVNNGSIAFTKAVSAAESRTYGITGNAAKTAYKVTDVTTDSNVTVTLDNAKLVYTDETYTFKVKTVADSGYKVATVSVKIGSSEPFAATDNGDGTYSFVMPTVARNASGDVTITATAVGKYSASFYLIYSDTKEVVPFTVVSGLTDSTGTTIEGISTPSVSHYSFGGWYTDQAMSTAASTTSGTGTSASTTYVKSLTFYADMQRYYTVTAQVENRTGGTVTPANATAVDGGSVELTIKAAQSTGTSPVDLYALRSVSANGVDVTSQVSEGKLVLKIAGEDIEVIVSFDPLYKVTGGYIKGTTASNGTEVTYDTTTANKLVYTVSSAERGSVTVSTAKDNESNFLAITPGIVAGTTVTLVPVPSSNYALASIEYGTLTGTTTKVYAKLGDVEADDDGVYSFEMPSSNIVIVASFTPLHTLTITQTGSQAELTVKAGGATVEGIPDSSTATTYAYKVAEGAKVTITLSKYTGGYNDGYAVSDVTVATGSNGSYSLTMPTTDTTVAITYGNAVAVQNTIRGSGNIVASTTVVATGNSIVYSIYPDNGAKLASYDVYSTEAMTGTVVADTIAKWTKNSDGTLSLKLTDGTTSKPTYYVLFQFTDVTYSDITVVDKTLIEGAEVTDVEIYQTRDATTGALSDKVTLDSGNKATVADGTYYIRIAAKNGYDINNASAVYLNDKVDSVDSDGTIHYAHRAGGFLNVQVIEKPTDSQRYAVYSVVIDDDATIYANYDAHQSVVSFENPTNGTFSVLVNGTAITSGAKVAFGTELTLSATATTSGYQVFGYTYKLASAASASNVIGTTYTVGDENVTLAATVAQGYAISITADDGITVTSSANPVRAGTAVTLTVSAAQGTEYTVTVDGTEVTLTNNTYRYTPTADSTVVAKLKSAPAPAGAAEHVTVSLGYHPVSMKAIVQLTPFDGDYVPAGTATVTVFFMNDGAPDFRTIQIDIAGASETGTLYKEIPTDTTGVSATVIGATVQYSSTDGSVTAQNTGFQAFAFTLTAAAATTEE